MKFTPIYYVCIACPTVEKTIEMVDKYVEHGATAFQIDMPSKDPFAETEFVKSMMKGSLDSVPDYDHYMDAIAQIRKKHPDLEIHIVVYDDVIDSIGTDKFCSFVKSVGAASIMVPGITPVHLTYAEKRGIKVFKGTIHEMHDEEIEYCAAAKEDDYISLRNKKPGEVDRPGYETWEKKYALMRERGVKGKIYSVFGIKSKEELAVVKKTGASGAIIGNVLMRLWNDEESLWKLFSDFQSLAE